ncbi:MAG: 3-oxoacyl-ACP synthase, partial [Nitrospira sp.]|nr:3-oxoacyl-ACP synthase [Nitrospira sp.]
VIFHQANGRMLTKFCENIGVPPERCLSIIEQVGNTSSASLSMALDHANRSQKLKTGDRVMLGAFGGGLTWGTALVRWG